MIQKGYNILNLIFLVFFALFGEYAGARAPQGLIVDSLLLESVNGSHGSLNTKNSTPYAAQKIDTTGKNTTPYKKIPFKSEDIFLGMGDSSETSYEIFGWYPYWFPDYYLEFDFDKISTVSYFSYEFSPKTGEKTESHDWARTAMIDSAEAHGCKILLTVTSFGASNNRIFLNNPSAVSQMIWQLKNTLKQRPEADGVCLDFELIGGSEKDEFTNFVAQLKQALGDEYEIYLALPSVDHNEVYDFPKLEPHIEKSVIMAYGYSGAWSDKPKPNAPIESEHYSLSNTVEYYTSRLESSNIILALPAYGMFWDVSPDGSSDFVGYRTLSYINANINGVAEIDSLSKAAHISYLRGDNNDLTREIWFNNEVSWYYQMELIKSSNMGGVGIWALGFEKNCPLFWEVIKSSLVKTMSTDTVQVAEVQKKKLSAWEKLTSFIENAFHQANSKQELILWVLMLIIGFGCIAFIISMFDYRTREYFTTNKFFKMLFTGSILLSLILFFLKTDKIDEVGFHSSDSDNLIDSIYHYIQSESQTGGIYVTEVELNKHLSGELEYDTRLTEDTMDYLIMAWFIDDYSDKSLANEVELRIPLDSVPYEALKFANELVIEELRYYRTISEEDSMSMFELVRAEKEWNHPDEENWWYDVDGIIPGGKCEIEISREPPYILNDPQTQPNFYGKRYRPEKFAFTKNLQRKLRESARNRHGNNLPVTFLLVVGFIFGVLSYVFVNKRIRTKRSQLP